MTANLNSILDEFIPTSTGGLQSASNLFHALGIGFSIVPPRTEYHRGWGDKV